MFELNDDEVEHLVSQNAIPSKQALGGAMPIVFTEHGVLMLANVIKSNQAIQMSIHIIEVFIKLRQILLQHKDILLKLEVLERNVTHNNNDINLLFQAVKELVYTLEAERQRIGFNV